MEIVLLKEVQKLNSFGIIWNDVTKSHHGGGGIHGVKVHCKVIWFIDIFYLIFSFQISKQVVNAYTI